MAGHPSKKVEELPARYFSSLYYYKQQKRGLPNELGLPTGEELAELEKLRTDYEGKPYEIPQEMLDITNAARKFDEIEETRQKAGLGSKDIRFFRQYVIDNKQSDYDYRYWLQYEVESMAAGQRSMRILTERDTEYEQAMKKLYELSLNISKSLVSLSENNRQDTLSDNSDAFLLLKEWNDSVIKDEEYFKHIKNSRLGAEFKSIDFELQNHINSNGLFYLIAKESVSVLFKNLNQVRRLRSLKKIRNDKKSKEYLPNVGFEIDEGMTKKDSDRDLRAQLSKELSKPENSELAGFFYYKSFVSETNIFFRKLVEQIDSVLTFWFRYTNKVDAKFEKELRDRGCKGHEPFFKHKKQVYEDSIREKCIKIATACLFTLNLEEIIDLDQGDIEELDYLYSKEYDSTSANPNVVRLTRKILSEELNNGDHAIIRHFQEDEKRNMYCLPKEHHKYDTEKTAGNGGFLHHGGKSVSLHYDLLSLVRAKEYDFTRFEPSENTLNTLNILQKTQWSINLDFLRFIADFTLDGKIVDDILDIRHASWTKTGNMKLRKIFRKMMELDDDQDTPTQSRLRTINSTLKQTRKNLLNSGNVFWHAWFCDWRSRFNPRVTQLSPQGGDLSKSLLLFTEWKKLGESGKKWLYVKAYDLTYKIITEENDKQMHKFEEKKEWVEKNLDKILNISSKLNRKTSGVILNDILERLQVKKAGPKSEIFQRIAFLIEFNRIHDELQKNNDNWDQVTSGLPIHLDASCNGFQHISALIRNRKLAKSTNILLGDDGNEKGDLYQEVANKAIEIYNGNDEEQLAKSIKKLFEKISKSKEEQELLVKSLLSRDICKPLVMITGYGAKSLKDPLMNLNGKKNKPGWYKTGLIKEGKKEFKRTTHIESILYKKIKQIHDVKSGSFGNLKISDEDGPLSPVQNCILLSEIVEQLTKYIKKCIAKVTNNGFEVINRQLEHLYQDIDSTGGISLSELKIKTEEKKKIDKIKDLLENLEKFEDSKLDKILKVNDLQIPKKNSEKIDKIKAHLINKKKNLLYFAWRISPEASLVRNVRWKVAQDRDTSTLSKKLLLSGYIAPSREGIIQFILDNSESISKEMLERLNNYFDEIRQEEIKSEKMSSKNGYLSRKLNKQINICLRTIVRQDFAKEIQQTAKNHLIARWVNKSKSGRLTVDAGKMLSFSKPIKGFHKNWAKAKIEILDNMSNDVIRGLVPNFIHSFDAMHMQMIIQELSKNGINDIWAVHDSFGVHACHVEKMRDIVKKTFVELHKDPLNVHIENIRKLNSNILKKKEPKNAKEDNENKKSGDSNDSQNKQDFFSIKEVLNSKYMIS